MAIRKIREIGDEILTKKSREIKEINDRIKELAQDMLDTMYEQQGVGLAAPQVGILKRLVVIDVSAECNCPIILVNPIVVETDGEQFGSEGCLSVPGKAGMVRRPSYARVKALDLDGKEIEVEGNELLARALLHECDHLDGKLYVDLVEGELVDVTEMEEE